MPPEDEARKIQAGKSGTKQHTDNNSNFVTTWHIDLPWLTPRMSHDEERVNGAQFRVKRDRALRHWLNPLVMRAQVPPLSETHRFI